MALFTARHPSASVIDQLRLYLSRELAEKVSLHGVFMDVLGLWRDDHRRLRRQQIRARLELISRGHGLVADDVVELSRIAPTVLEGRCPGDAAGFHRSTRPRINIRTIFGETACRRKMRLRLISPPDRRQPGPDDPCWLPLQQETHPRRKVARRAPGGGRTQPRGAARGRSAL